MCRSFPSTSWAVPRARHALRDFLAGEVEGDLLDDLALITSELVTNAVKFGRRHEDIWLQIALTDREITVTVSGHSRGDIAAGLHHGADDSLSESGRGLRIVRDLSDDFTVYRSGLTMMRSSRARR